MNLDESEYLTLLGQMRLEELGDTAAEVGRSLKQEGILGVKQKPGRCPIAACLNRIYPDSGGALVGTLFATVCFRGLEDVNLRLPYAVINFINDFDAGLWPELELNKQ